MLPKNRPPTPPGEMLLEEYLRPRGITQVELASRMRVPIQRVNTIVNGKRGITAETAILLAEALNTSPEFWMGLQANHGP
jgi:antitoxin HigA-1